MKAPRVAGPSKAARAREQRLEEVRACACRTLAASDVTEPSQLDIDHIAAVLGAEVVFDDLEGATARVIQIGDRATIVVSTRIAEIGSIRFSIAHEIGHMLCKHYVRRAAAERAVERLCSPLSIDGTTAEREASVFAAELLMPAFMVAPWCTVAPPSLDRCARSRARSRRPCSQARFDSSNCLASVARWSTASSVACVGSRRAPRSPHGSRRAAPWSRPRRP